jgi:hypothetical protein
VIYCCLCDVTQSISLNCCAACARFRAQRLFRERTKQRWKENEEKLQLLMGQVERLEQEKNSMHTRNMILEKLVYLRNTSAGSNVLCRVRAESLGFIDEMLHSCKRMLVQMAISNDPAPFLAGFGSRGTTVATTARLGTVTA